MTLPRKDGPCTSRLGSYRADSWGLIEYHGQAARFFLLLLLDESAVALWSLGPGDDGLPTHILSSPFSILLPLFFLSFVIDTHGLTLPVLSLRVTGKSPSGPHHLWAG